MDGGNFLTRIGQWPARTKSYIEDLRQEMRRVTWPNAKQVRATTGVVIGTVFLFSAYFFVVDSIVSNGINRLYKMLGGH